MPETETKKHAKYVLEFVGFVVMAFLVVYAPSLGPSLYKWLGLVLFGCGVWLVFLPPFTEKKYGARFAVVMLGVGACLAGFGMMGELSFLSFKTWLSTLQVIGIALILAGAGLVAAKARSFLLDKGSHSDAGDGKTPTSGE